MDPGMKGFILFIIVLVIGAAFVTIVDVRLLRIKFDNVPTSLIYRLMYMVWGAILVSVL